MFLKDSLLRFEWILIDVQWSTKESTSSKRRNIFSFRLLEEFEKFFFLRNTKSHGFWLKSKKKENKGDFKDWTSLTVSHERTTIQANQPDEIVRFGYFYQNKINRYPNKNLLYFFWFIKSQCWGISFRANSCTAQSHL